ncbi:TonB-dependent receptor [Albibacterium bauzanense]|uniref:Uncharacterized protein n=1 Tax=Albibacterium bauzanense TaxID=653929 RepID=A0A4R1M3T4_9SPHI|nr:TonB-dependent receptor [Albibacterium bauzanense]TCK85750.1 hypothetical protein C8N28_1063 [Albibacterium bauzanense]
MILKSSILKHTFILGFCAFSFNAYSQVDTTKTQEPATIEEVEVVRDYRPVLADAVKIRRSPDLNNVRTQQPALRYNVLDKRLNFPSGMGQLTLQEMQSSRPGIMTNNYAKLGIGNFNSILGEIYINSGTDENYQTGFYAKHLNQKGDLENQKFSEQRIGIFGRSILEKITLSGELGFNRYGTAFYGVVPGAEDNPIITSDAQNQHFNDIFFVGELLKNYDPQDTDLSYSLKTDVYLFSDAFNAKENSFAISGYLNKAINVFNIGANVSADMASVKAADYSISNNLIRLNPYIRFQGNNYKITLGANFISESGETSRSNLFPLANLELDVVPEFVSIFGSVKGDVNRTSLRSLAQSNPYLNENIAIRNTIDRLNITAGVKGNVGATFGYKASVFYRKVEDLPLFVNSPNEPKKFDLIYDAGIDKATSISGLEGEINVRVSETVNIGGKLNISDYKLSTEREAWFMPKVQISSNARINISEKVFLNAEVLFAGETSAKTYDYSLAAIPVTDYTTADPIIKRVPAFADFSAGAEYRVNQQFGIFIQANNLLNSNYEKYLYYPRLGFNVFGGLNYSF